jgi:hypothetical protein
MIPDVALLEIFDIYVDETWIEEWYTLVHVCRKWRNVIFRSPRRLNLRLYCKARTPVRETLGVWPLLPIVIMVYGYEMWGVDNIIAALEHNDRVFQLNLIDFPSSQFGKVLAAMQRPFPTLTLLRLGLDDETSLVQPELFLGGSAPRLQTLHLDRIPFPGLPKLLLSATDLVDLELRRIPDSGYISPEAMATGLSVLTRLKRLVIKFDSSRYRPDRRSRRLPPPTRDVLPNLNRLRFIGVGNYFIRKKIL